MADSSDIRCIIAIYQEAPMTRLAAIAVTAGSQRRIDAALRRVDDVHAKGRGLCDADAKFRRWQGSSPSDLAIRGGDLLSPSTCVSAATKDAILVPRRGLEPPQCCHR